MKSIIQKNKECWKTITGYEGFYKINQFGDIISLKFVNGTTNRERKTPLYIKSQIRNGYKIVNLSKNGERRQHSVHRLVAQEFVENPNSYPFVNHKDYNKLNNNAENLEWCTQEYNVNYSKINMIGKNHIFGNKENYGIFYRGKRKTYELTIKKKYYGNFKTLKEARKRRDEILNELNIAI